jgi:type IV pilus assembly protein PilN
LLLFILLLAGWFISLATNVSSLKNKESSKKVELEGYKKELEEIKKLEAAIKEIKSKLDVINNLKKGKTGPVLLLSAVADAVPKEKLYLTNLKEASGILTLTGVAMDNETVALFMDNLGTAKDVITPGSVELKSIKQKEINKLKVADFSLECKTYAYKAEPKKTESKKKKGK